MYKVGRVIGLTVKYAVSFSKLTISDERKAREIAREVLLRVLPAVCDHLVSDKWLREFVRKVIFWDKLVDILLDLFFSYVTVEDINRLLEEIRKWVREMKDLIAEMAIECAFRFAVERALQAHGITFMKKEISENASLYIIIGPKGGRVFVSFRW